LEPIGVEALLHLRLEKGFLHIGTDTDGSTVPDDVGWGRAAAAKARDFIGKRSLLLPENQRSNRLQLVGLTRLEGERLRAGAHVRLQGTQTGSNGWITSSGDLLSDGSSIAPALIRAGRSRMGSVVSVHDAGVNIASASVVAAQFYDPGGVRMNG
jgi:sarcosine oxidase subunit alpha